MNKFKLNEVKLIRQAKKVFEQSRPMLTKNGLGVANWTDDWVCFPRGRRIIMNFGRWVDKPQDPKFDLARAFALEQVSLSLGSNSKICNIQYAFRVISILNQELCNLEQFDLDNLTKTFKKKNYNHNYANAFWEWCKTQGILPVFLQVPTHRDKRDRTPEEGEEASLKKLIGDEQVAAIGVAYNQLFSEEGLIKYGFKYYPKEYLTVAFCTLALSTPSRINSEIFCLPNQKIKRDREHVTDHLFWKGSKNFPDNCTHLLDALTDNVEHIFEVLEHESMPAKILSYFMAQPSLSLNEVMKAYPQFKYKHKSYPNLDLYSQTTIFHLGLILGFYDKEPAVPIMGVGDESIPIHFNKTWKSYKYLSAVSKDEIIVSHRSLLHTLTGKIINNPSSLLNRFKPYYFKGSKDRTTLLNVSNEIIKANVFNNGSVDLIVRGYKTCIAVTDAFFVYTAATIHGGVGSQQKAQSSKLIPVPSIYDLLISDKRPHFDRQWIKSTLSLVGLGSMEFSPHQLRHWVNHHAKESGIPIEIINLWSGRKDADQAYEYIHTNDEDNSQQIKSVLVRNKNIIADPSIKFISFEKIKILRNLPATIMSEGLCTQDLVTTPCRFLNDFMTSCFGCQSMCYIKGDKKALDILQYDLDIQRSRLKKIKSYHGFFNNKASQEWYKTHFNKVSVLDALLIVLKDDSILDGSSVRIIGDLASLEFRVQNLNSGNITVFKPVLEDANKSCNDFIENNYQKGKGKNMRLLALLNKYGVNGGKE